VINNKISSEFKNDEISIKPEGVYIITGGTGTLGLEAGKYLTSKSKVNLALINRSKMPDREKWDEIIKEEKKDIRKRVEAILDMEKSGAKVNCFSVDITVESELDKLLSHLRREYGKINGIIHCAAVGVGSGSTLIEDITSEAFGEMLLPKVKGTWLIDKLTQTDNMDFFVMYSSVITTTGGIGTGSYTAANSFLDSFAALRKRSGRKTLTVNWPVLENEKLQGKIDNKKLMFNI
jgi:NAD(P)-dependent dehydrogenase (short-subunit alcohol dehydrogenase family)